MDPTVGQRLATIGAVELARQIVSGKSHVGEMRTSDGVRHGVSLSFEKPPSWFARLLIMLSHPFSLKSGREEIRRKTIRAALPVNQETLETIQGIFTKALEGPRKRSPADRGLIEKATAKIQQIAKQEAEAIQQIVEKEAQTVEGLKENLTCMKKSSDMVPADFYRFLLDFSLELKKGGGSSGFSCHDLQRLEEDRLQYLNQAEQYEEAAKSEVPLSKASEDLLSQAALRRALAQKCSSQRDEILKERAYQTLRTLAEPSELQTIEEMIEEIEKQVKASPPQSFESSLESALKKKLQSLPLHFKYLLLTQGQGFFKPLREGIIRDLFALNDFVGAGGDLDCFQGQFMGGSAKTTVVKDAQGLITHMESIREQPFFIGSLKHGPSDSGPFKEVISFSLQLTTTIDVKPDGSREVHHSVECIPPQVHISDPEYHLIAHKIASAYRDTSISETIPDPRKQESQ